MFHEYIRSTFTTTSDAIAAVVNNEGEEGYDWYQSFVEGSTDKVIVRSSFTTTTTATNFLRGLQHNGSTTTSTKVDEAYYTSQIRQEKDDISSNLTLQGKIIVGIVFMILLFILLGLFHWYFNHKYSQETERAISTYVEARSDSRTAQIALEEDAVVVKRRLRLIKQVDKQKFYVKECDILTDEELTNYIKQIELQQQQQQLKQKKSSPTNTTTTSPTSLKKENNSTYWSSFSNRAAKKKVSKDITISTSTSSLTSLNEETENNDNDECNIINTTATTVTSRNDDSSNNKDKSSSSTATTTNVLSQQQPQQQQQQSVVLENNRCSSSTEVSKLSTSFRTTNETVSPTTEPKKKMTGTHRTGERDVFQDVFRIDCCGGSNSSLDNASSKSFGSDSDSSSVTIDTYLLLPSCPTTSSTGASSSSSKKQLVLSKQQTSCSKKQLLSSPSQQQQQQQQQIVPVGVVAPVIVVVQQPRRYVRNCCSICLGSYVKNDQVVWSSNPNCSHVFHYDCIMRWLCQRDENLCPMCRRIYVKMPGMNGNGSKKKLTEGVANASDDNEEEEEDEDDSFDDDNDDDNDDEYYNDDDNNEPLSWSENNDDFNDDIINNENERRGGQEDDNKDDIEQVDVATDSVAAASSRNVRRSSTTTATNITIQEDNNSMIGRPRSEQGHHMMIQRRRVSFAQSMTAVTDSDDITYIDESSRIGEHNSNSLRSELTSYIGNDSHRSHSSIIMNINNDDDDEEENEIIDGKVEVEERSCCSSIM